MQYLVLNMTDQIMKALCFFCMDLQLKTLHALRSENFHIVGEFLCI